MIVVPIAQIEPGVADVAGVVGVAEAREVVEVAEVGEVAGVAGVAEVGEVGEVAEEVAGWRAIERVAFDPGASEPADPLGPLTDLPGTWRGRGFDAIWRPHIGGQDRFLELNLTTETLVFSPITGAIPNWGLLRPDINLVGLSCMHQIAEASSGAGLHIEPGVFAHTPPSTDPREPGTVVRMASIPARTLILAQGTSQRFDGGPPHIPDNHIIPSPIGGPAPAHSHLSLGEPQYPELDLSVPSAFRYAWPGVTQAMVENPNSILQAAIDGKRVSSRTVIRVSSSPRDPHPARRGVDTEFLAAASSIRGGQGNELEVDATFWIETVAGTNGRPDTLQLQYSQRVQLDFNGHRWPHVRVATLHKLVS
jgi:hypothetical protein